MKTVEDYINLKPVTPNAKIAYGNHPEQFGELYLPKTKQPLYPVIILLHGGCWQAAYGLSPLGQLSKALTMLGFAVWNVEFRRLGNGGGFPNTFKDVANGADFLKSIASKYSLDINNVISMGHSAGGHLALWLAGRHHLPHEHSLFTKTALTLTNVVSLAGIPDLVEGVKQNICRGACEELVGGPPEVLLKEYQIASPHLLLPFNITHTHLVGENDPIVPVEYLRTFINTAKQHDRVNFDIVPNIGHFEMIMPDTVAWSFIEKALAGK